MSPLYEYKCPDCGYTIEYIMSFADASDEGEFCPECAIAAAERGAEPDAISSMEPPVMERQIGTLATWRWRGGYVPPGGMKHQDG